MIFDFEKLIESLREVAARSLEASDTIRAEYEERRRCVGRRKDGQPCRAWAVWDSPTQLCAAHLYPHRRKDSEMTLEIRRQHRRRGAPVCNCPAYSWPHREGSGLCREPDDEPLACWPTPSGKRQPGKLRCRDRQRIMRKLGLT
jgi:hypothetical protein